MTMYSVPVLAQIDQSMDIDDAIFIYEYTRSIVEPAYYLDACYRYNQRQGTAY